MIRKNSREQKARQLQVKQRRDASEESNEKLRILQHHRWPLIKCVRTSRLQAKSDELDWQRWARAWAIYMQSR